MPGVRVGAYELGAQIGSGATGTVYAAFRSDLQLQAAVKQLAPSLAADPAFLTRFQAEAQVMARLDDTHCVRVFDFITTEDGAFLVMEFIDGASLRRLMDNSVRLTAEQLVGTVQGALLGLGHAHNLGLVHRDIKPSNILCNREGTSKLSDFGQMADAGAIANVGGTPSYMSPELLAGAAVDNRSDIYSVGAVLYEALEGQPPFVADSIAGMQQLQQTAALPPFQRTPAGLQPVLLKALDKDPSARPQSVPEMLGDLQAGAATAYGSDWQQRATFVLAGAAAGVAAGAAASMAGGGAASGTAVVGPAQVLDSGGPGAGGTADTAAQAQPRPRGRSRRARTLSAAVALLLLAGSIGVARLGVASSAHTTPLGLRFNGQGQAAPSGATPTASECAVANLSFTFTAAGAAADVAKAVGKPLEIQLTGSSSSLPLVGKVASVTVDANGAAQYTFGNIGVPHGGASWTARAVNLGDQVVDGPSSQPVTVGVTCAA
jgi:hypothetical protein